MTAIPVLGSYAAFKANPSRRNIYLFDVTVRDADGVTQTLYWSRGQFTSEPTDSPADTTWEPRILEGGIDYQSPTFDPHNPSFGTLPSAAPSPIVAVQFDGDLDQYRTWLWAGAKFTVRHGGWTQDGYLPLAQFRTIATFEVDGWPIFGIDRVTFPLRSREARFDVPLEPRTFWGLGWCLEGDGATAGVQWNPVLPNCLLHATVQTRVGDFGANVTAQMPANVPEDALMLAWISSHGNTVGGAYQDWSISAAPAGWSLVDSAVVTSGGTPARRLYLYSKVAGASEPASYTWTGTGTPCNRILSVEVWVGVDGTTPVVASADASGGPGTTATAPTVTTTNPGDKLSCGYTFGLATNANPPPGMTLAANVTKNTSTGNGLWLRTAWEDRPTTGATGTRAVTMGNSTWCAIAVVIGNRASGGDPDKLDITDWMTVQFPMIPYNVGANQHLFGWERTPFRAFIDSSGHLNWSWEKATATVTKTSAFTFEAEHRYAIEIYHADTYVQFVITDWADAGKETTETFTGTGFNGRDGFSAGDEFTMMFNDNAGSPTDFYDGQLWTVRIWNTLQDEGVMADRRTRPLNDAEKLETALKFHVPFREKNGPLVTDESPNGIVGGIVQTVTGPTTLTIVAADPANGVPAKLTRSAGSFITDGWVAGRCGNLTAFASAKNNVRAFVLTVAAGEIEMAGGAFVSETGSGDERFTADDWRPTLTGGESVVGQQVPNAWGGPFDHAPGIPCEESDADGFYFNWHPTEIEAFHFIMEGGGFRPFDLDHATYRSFLGTVPAAGRFSTYKGPAGSFASCRLAPAFPITARVTGETDGTAAPFTACTIIRRALTTRGEERVVDPTELDTSSITTADALAPHPIGTVVGDGETIADFSRRILGGVGILCWALRDGRFRFKQFRGVTGADLQHIHRHVYQAGGPQTIQVELPVRELEFKYRHNPNVLERDQISGTQTDTRWLRMLMMEWSILRARRGVVAYRYPRSRVMEVAAYFCHEFQASQHAATEAARLMDLYAQPAQFYALSSKSLGTPLEFMDEVKLTISDIDLEGSPRARFGVDYGDFVVTFVQDDTGAGMERLQLWNQDSTEDGEGGGLEP